MSQVSLASSHPADHRPAPLRRPGWWLVAILAAAVASAALSAYLALSPVERVSVAPVPALDSVSRPVTPSQPPLALPGFQRRGPLLTGEVRTSDGSTLRLVIDSRSHAIVGYRLVEGPQSAATPR